MNTKKTYRLHVSGDDRLYAAVPLRLKAI